MRAGLAVVVCLATAPAAGAQTLPLESTIHETHEAFSFNSDFGLSMSSIGDFDGDGFSDIVIGGPAVNFDTRGGGIHVFYGSRNGLVGSSLWSWVEDDQVDADHGISVTWAGDVNGDGYDDFAVGAPGYRPGGLRVGTVDVYFGGFARKPSAPKRYTAGPGPIDFGTRVAGVGDINGDGYDDVAASAPVEAVDGNPRGGVYLMYGGQGQPAGFTWTYRFPPVGSLLGMALAGVGDIDGDGYNDIVAGAPGYQAGGVGTGAVFVFFGSPQGPAARPDIIIGASDGGSVGATVVLADVNGDGYSDVLAGDPDYFHSGNSNRGRVFVYTSRGSARAFDPPAVLNRGIGRFGQHLACVGDLDDDGADDVMVGTLYGYSNQPRELAYLYMGSPAGLPVHPTQIIYTIADRMVRLEGTVVGAGDVDDDGVLDVMVGNPAVSNNRGEAYEIHGRRLMRQPHVSADASWAGPNDTGAFASSMARAGDIDGDGWDELIVGSPLDDERVPDGGAAHIYRGSPAGWASDPAWSLAGDRAGAWFGQSVTGIGDVDGDGYADFAVGAPHATVYSADEGAVSVYRGSAHGPLVDSVYVARGLQTASAFGVALGSGGDVNGDGYSDLIVGAPGFDGDYEDEGRVVVYYGNPHRLAAANSWSASGRQAGAALGSAVAFAGDVNRDGFTDVVAGAPYYDAHAVDDGAVVVFLGGVDGLHDTPLLALGPGVEGARLGVSVACAGDVDNDAFADIIAGAGSYGASMGPSGTAFLFRGGVGGVSAAPDWSAGGQLIGGAFGRSVRGVGDVNGDGYDDVAVGDPLYDGGFADRGRVAVFFGGSGGLEATPGLERVGVNNGQQLGLVLENVGDTDGDGGFDIMAAGSGEPRLQLFGSGSSPMAHVSRFVVPRGGAGSVAIMGYSGDPDFVDLSVRFRPPPGSSRIALEYQMRRSAQAWVEDIVRTPWRELTVEERRAGSWVTETVAMDITTGSSPRAWRVRVMTSNPLQRTSRWYYHQTQPIAAPSVRVGRFPDVPPPPPDERPDVPVPDFEFNVSSPFPNPFNPNVTIPFTLAGRARVQVTIFDVAGRVVDIVTDDVFDAGEREVRWSGYGRDGNRAASGVYFARVESSGRTETRRLVLVR